MLVAMPSQPEQDVAAYDRIRDHADRLRTAIARLIIGQDAAVETLMAALLCGGHTLVVGVPGLAKTLLVRAFAAALGLDFKRIQFTPDMMPSDILGTELIQEDPDTGRRTLQFVPGPVFANLVLADEINRTPPKTQSALLEAMAEQQVTVAGKPLPMPDPFLVVATQNPIEQEGTYPLPEAQLDRFMFSLWLDYPGKDDEVRIVDQTPRIRSEQIEPVITRDELRDYGRLIWQVPVSSHVTQYAVSLARATRPTEPDAPAITRKYVEWGVGPRGGQFLVLGAKALAAIHGEPTPNCDHIRRIAMAVFRHRLLVNYAASGEGITPDQVVSQIIKGVAEPNYPPD